LDNGSGTCGVTPSAPISKPERGRLKAVERGQHHIRTVKILVPSIFAGQADADHARSLSRTNPGRGILEDKAAGSVDSHGSGGHLEPNRVWLAGGDILATQKNIDQSPDAKVLNRLLDAMPGAPRHDAQRQTFTQGTKQSHGRVDADVALPAETAEERLGERLDLRPRRIRPRVARLDVSIDVGPGPPIHKRRHLLTRDRHAPVQKGQLDGFNPKDFRSEAPEPKTGGASIYLAMEDVNAAIEELKAKGVSIVYGPMETPVCWMAAVLDPDGNVIGMHQRKDGSWG